MGIRTALRLIEGGKALATDRAGYGTGIVSPFQVGGPNKIVWSDVFGTEAQFITREEAMTVPAFYKARAILAGQIAPVPLRCYDENGLVAEQPKWMYRTDGQVSPHHRMLWTVDDILTAGWSLWGVEREAGPDSAIARAERIPIEWWHFNADSEIVVNDEIVQAHEVILIPGPSEGFLQYATRSMRGAVALEEAYVKRARNPLPLVELHETVEGALTEEEAEQLVQDYMDARNDVNGTVTFTPSSIQLIAHGETAAPLVIDGRNFAKVDVANFTNLPAQALDGSLSQASLTYSTEQGTRNEILDYSLSYWSDPIAARLSMDDVVKPGERTRYDFAQLRTTNPSPTGPVTKD